MWNIVEIMYSNFWLGNQMQSKIYPLKGVSFWELKLLQEIYSADSANEYLSVEGNICCGNLTKTQL